MRRGALSRAANMVVAIVAMAVGVSLLVSASNIFIRIIALREIHSYLGKGSTEKKTFSFGHCANEGGGGLPMPEFFGPLFRSAFLVNKKSLFLQKCQCIELLTGF